MGAHPVLRHVSSLLVCFRRFDATWKSALSDGAGSGAHHVSHGIAVLDATGSTYDSPRSRHEEVTGNGWLLTVD